MNKQETSADIIAEIRELSKSAKHCELLVTVYGKPLDLYIAELADRLEAAWKREKAAIEADALAAGGLVEASRTTTENSSAVGAAAKLREAAEKVVEITKREWDAFRETAAMEAMHKICKAALAAPRKNCDRFQTWDEAKDAYWREQGDPCDWRKLGAWLFALEGGAK